MNTSMKYIGDVKITISRKSYKYRNSGHPNLFEYLARILSGQTDAIPKISPAYLTLTKNPGSSDPQDQINIENIELSKNFKTSLNGPICLVTAVITPSNLQYEKNNVTDSYLNILNKSHKCLASVTISAAILKQIQSGRQALIEWSLRFSNKGE